MTDLSQSVHRLHVVCERNAKAPKGSAEQYINEYVKSGDFVWEPQGEQRSIFEVDPAPTNKVCLSVSLACPVLEPRLYEGNRSCEAETRSRG